MPALIVRLRTLLLRTASGGRCGSTYDGGCFAMLLMLILRSPDGRRAGDIERPREDDGDDDRARGCGWGLMSSAHETVPSGW